jgi:uncharacterized protein YegJ (DUF2314 family)
MKWNGLLLAVALLAACGGDPVPEDGPPPIYKYASMKAAVAEARETLPAFWTAFESGDPAYSAFALNVITVSDRYTEEHVWVVDIRQVQDGSFSGVVPEAHVIHDGFAPGDLIAFQPEHVADWRYDEDGKYRGAYTTRAMLGQVPNADIDNIKAMFHESPLP